MMTIKTRWHKFVEELQNSGVTVHHSDDPLFVIDKTNTRFQTKEAFEECVILYKNNLLNLPFDQFNIEISDYEGKNSFSIFIFVNGIKVRWAFYIPSVKGWALMETDAVIDFYSEMLTITHPKSVKYRTSHKFSDEDNEEVGKQLCSYIEVVVDTLAVLMTKLNTKGYVIDTTKAPAILNKMRKRKGKPPIPDVSIIKIGHYYDKTGNRVEHDERRPVRVHWRRGHNRTVWCGPRGDQHKETRFIKACLVNYDPDNQSKPLEQIRIV